MFVLCLYSDNVIIDIPNNRLITYPAHKCHNNVPMFPGRAGRVAMQSPPEGAPAGGH